MDTIDSKVPPKRFQIIRWNAVSLWSYDEEVEQICTLCKELITKPCTVCIPKDTMECGVQHGVCNHVFHDCCITKWLLEGQTTCPQTDCHHMWEVRRSGV